MKQYIAAVLMLSLSLTAPAQAADPQPEPIHYSYYELEPDFITNYISSGKTLGYIRLTVTLMVKHTSELALLEHHDPLIRDTILVILGRQDKEKVSSLAGREEIRKECLDTVNDLMLREVGKKLLVDLIFTHYVYQ